MGWLRTLLDEKNKQQSKLVGNQLKQARKYAGMTQTQAAAQLGRDQTFITRIESGSREVTFVELEQLAKLYNKPLSFFESIEEVERLNPSLVVTGNVVVKQSQKKQRNTIPPPTGKSRPRKTGR